MFCPKCGKENPNEAQLCNACGWVFSGISNDAVPNARMSKLAIASLVLGFISPFTYFLTAIPAIIFGIVAFVKINKSQGQLKGKVFAITGAIWPILTMLSPAVSEVRPLSLRLICGKNVSGLGKAMMFYANDHNDMYPTPSKWCDLLIEKVGADPMQFKCRAVSDGGRCNYALNKNIEQLGRNAPSYMVLLFESDPGWNLSGGPELLTTKNHGGQGCNILFVCGHVKFVKTKDIPNLKWTADPNK